MKDQTLAKFKELSQNKRILFTDVAEGLQLEHDLTDSELAEIVQIEYGQTEQSVVELFTVLCKKLVKHALENGNVPA